MPISPDKIRKAREIFEKERKGPLWTPRNKALAALALLYVISPIDLLPDWFLPFFGWLDDLGVVSMVALWICRHRGAPPQEAAEPHPTLPASAEPQQPADTPPSASPRD